MKIDDNELKNIEYNILKNVAEFCKKNNLNYFICYGTLLGGVRHKGFIPWDDDIDIMMPRKDYEHFIKEYKDIDYKVGACEIDKTYIYPFAKVYDKHTVLIEDDKPKNDCEIGVYIDVFPLDNLPKNWFKRKIRLNIIKLMRYYYISNVCIVDKKIGFVKYIGSKILNKNKNGNDISIKWNNIAKKSNFKESKYIANQVWGYLNKEEMEYKKIFPIKQNEIFFCKNYFSSPNDYDYYLKKLYGDYMSFPPKNKQVTHHNFVAYQKEMK